jgi:glycosyltransferase involved in cell wall biosynthesis
MTSPTIIIPAYQPNNELVSLIKALTRNPNQRIILVDDGSTGNSREIIDAIDKDFSQVDVLRHAINLGKSKAIRTGFNHYLLNYANDSIGIVTVDSDERFNQNDISKIIECFVKNPRTIVVGIEKPENKQSRFLQVLNNFFITSLQKFTGATIVENSTDLRGIPKDVIVEFLKTDESENDFELDMLIKATQNKHSVLEMPIQNINKIRYNNPFPKVLRDSTKTIFVFLRFSLLSMSAAAIDFAVFSIAFINTKTVFSSMVIARIVSGTFQFTLGKRVVFKSTKKIFGEIIRYVLLVIVLMLLSYGVLTPMVVYLKINTYLAKVIAEVTIFLLSFAAQRILVFSKESSSIKTK